MTTAAARVAAAPADFPETAAEPPGNLGRISKICGGIPGFYGGICRRPRGTTPKYGKSIL